MGSKRSCYSKVRDAFSTDNVLAKVLLAEFLGTFVLIVLGDGSVAQHILSDSTSGEFISVNIAWGLAVAMGVWVSGEASGGHINPAVTLAFCIYGRCPWSHFPVYWIGQYLGAIAGAAVVFGTYYEALNDFDGGIRVTDPANATATAGIWATYPKPYLTWKGGFGDQIVGTAMLMLLVMAITDKNNHKPPKGMVPFCVGLVVMVIGMSYGHNCGYAINPARDWGPRIFTCMAGWGTEPFTYRDYMWFWVPFAGPHVGAVIGGWLYLLFAGNHIRSDDDDDDDAKSVGESDLAPILKTSGIPRPDYDRSAVAPPYGAYGYDSRRAQDGHPPSNISAIELRGMHNHSVSDDAGHPIPAYRDENRYSRPQSDNYGRHPASKRPVYNAYVTEKSFL